MDGTGEADSPSEASSSRPDWKPGEWELRSQEVATHTRASRVQTWTTLAALVAAGVAIFAAVNASRSIQVAADGVRRQADESRLTTAVNSLGADLPAQRVAGFTLLRRHALQRLESANEGNATASERRDALRLYRGTIDVFVNYLVKPNPDASSPNLGVGAPDLSRDAIYAGVELKRLLQSKAEFVRLWKTVTGMSHDRSLSDLFFTTVNTSREEAVRNEPFPAIDLSSTNLYGTNWEDTDFSWLDGHAFAFVDLRKAFLFRSNWNGSNLENAFLRCANLTSAHLEGANLKGADLRRATLVKADLRKANLRGAHLQGATLDGANLDGADVAAADFTDANIGQKTLDKAKNHQAAVATPGQPSADPDLADGPPSPDAESQGGLECRRPY
jgi:uncharacterized protein YjbI with pentapeptide repeats